jgi:hypothetical protein
VRPSVEAVRLLASSARLTGASGLVRIMAPCPTGDSFEFPTELMAVTLA